METKVRLVEYINGHMSLHWCSRWC